MRETLMRLRRAIGTTKIARRIHRRLPSAKRCKECLVPFLGMFSVPYRLVQIRLSRKNPNLCTL